MNEKLKREIQSSIKRNGYIVIVEDENDRQEEFLKDLQTFFPEIAVLLNYSLDKSIGSIKEMLQSSPLMLANLDDALDDVFQRDSVYNKKLTKKESVYYSLIEFREHTRKYPLVVLCNSKNKSLIMTSAADLTSHIGNIIFLDRYREEMLP